MSLSPTGEKLIQKLKAEASRSQVSDTGSKVIEQMNKKSQSDYFNSVLPPEAAMGATANSSQQVKKERSSLGKIFAGGVLFGGADAGDYAEVGKMFAQGVARGYQATGSFLARTAADPKNASLKNSPVVDPKTIFGNSERAASIGTAIFGTEEPFSLKSEGDDIFNFIGLDNATPWQSASFAVLMTTADLFTGGASSGLRGSMLALKSADNVADTAKVMRTMGFDEDIVSDYAPLFSKADNAEDIGDIFMGASKLQQSTKLINNAPINILDGSKPITPAGKVFSTSASDMRKSLLKTLSENRGVVDKGVESRVLRNASPTVNDYQVVIDTLQDAGIKMDDAVETLADLKETMRTDPKRFVPKYAEKTDLDLPPSKKGTLLVTEGAFRVREGDVPVRGTDDLQDLPVTDARFKQEGRIPVAQEAAVKNIPIEDARYAKEGTVPVSGVRNAEPQAGLVTGTQPLREGTIPVTGPKNAQTVPIKQGSKVTGPTDIEVKKLDEIAQPDRHPMSIPASKIQERYGDNGLKVKQLDNITEVEESLISQLNAVFTGDAFPAWVPRELQNAGLFERVIDMLKNGEVPTVHGSGEMELYTTFLDESARRAGITAKPERSVSPGQAMVQAMREKMGAPVVPRAERQYEKSSVVNKDTPDFGTKIDNAEQAVEDYKKYNRHMQTASGHKGFNEGEVKSFGFLYAEDLSGFKGWVKDMYRNSEKVFGDAWPAVKKRVFDKFDDAKGAMVRTEAEQIGKVKAQVVDALGIKRKSKLSALVQKYGEKTDGFSYDEVVALVGKADADKIHTAHTFFRAEYDRMIIEINDINKKLFPGRKDKQITPRQNYYRHFNELTELDRAYKAFEDPGLGNLSNKETPTNRWLSIALKRLGLKTDFDAVGGFLDYVPQYAFAKHVEPATQEIMAFKKSIRENTSAGQLDNYLAMLDRMTDDLLGLANPLDGGFESLFGRRALNVLDYTNKRVKRNAILGNAGTAISQIFNVPNAVMQAGPIHSAVGIKRALAEVMNPDAASWSRGTFINERYKQGMYDQFNVGMMENSMQFAGWMISVLDEAGTKFAWYAHYDKALKTMIDVDAIRYADDMTRKSVAGRGIGEVPIMQKGKVFQTIAPFQLEVANTLFNLGDVALAAGKAEGSVAK